MNDIQKIHQAVINNSSKCVDRSIFEEHRLAKNEKNIIEAHHRNILKHSFRRWYIHVNYDPKDAKKKIRHKSFREEYQEASKQKRLFSFLRANIETVQDASVLSLIIADKEASEMQARVISSYATLRYNIYVKKIAFDILKNRSLSFQNGTEYMKDIENTVFLRQNFTLWRDLHFDKILSRKKVEVQKLDDFQNRKHHRIKQISFLALKDYYDTTMRQCDDAFHLVHQRNKSGIFTSWLIMGLKKSSERMTIARTDKEKADLCYNRLLLRKSLMRLLKYTIDSKIENVLASIEVSLSFKINKDDLYY